MHDPKRSKRDVDRLADPQKWPYWPILPVKRHGSQFLETGWVTADYPAIVLRERPTTRGVLLQLRCESSDEELAALGFFDPRKLFGENVRPIYESQIVARYQDTWALVDAGWQVD